jgi:hypothetical protein
MDSETRRAIVERASLRAEKIGIPIDPDLLFRQSVERSIVGEIDINHLKLLYSELDLRP